MTKILKTIWAFIFYFWFAFTFVLLYPLFWLFLQSESTYKAANRLRIIWASTFCFLSGIIRKVTFEQPLDYSKTYIYCANHSSYLDIPLVGLSIGHTRFFYMAKAELSKVPLFKIFFKTVDVAVDRRDPIKAAMALKLAQEKLKKMDLIIFPEGTTSTIMPKLMSFKTGPFKLAITTGSPIVPTTVLDNWKMLPNDGKHMGMPGKTRIIFHKPIETKGLTDKDIPALKQQTFEVIENALKLEYGSR